MLGYVPSPRVLDAVANADTRAGYRHLRRKRTVGHDADPTIPFYQVGPIERAIDTHGLRQAPGSTGQVANARWKAARLLHQIQALQRFHRPKQYAVAFADFSA